MSLFQKTKYTRGEEVVIGYDGGGGYVYDDQDGNIFHVFLYNRDQWKAEPLIEIPTAPFAVIKVRDILMVNLADKKADLLGAAYPEFNWVRITADGGYGNAYGEKYIEDSIAAGEKFEVIYHGETKEG